MQLPATVEDWLQRELLAASRPFCMQIDADGCLLEHWGDGSWSGFESLAAGEAMLDKAPWLIGLFAPEPVSLEFVEIAPDRIVHVHTLPADTGHYVVLIDASREHGGIRQRQQTVNELRLMHFRQQRLIARQRELISELVEAKSELDHHRREAERASASKSRFIAMMSHEFRTPLASIVNYAELASGADAASAEVGKSLETITRSARHMMSLVETLLDEARLDAGQIELHDAEFDLYALFNDLSAMMAPLAAEKGLSFATQVDPDVPKHVRADEVRLRQILINLLGNAVKFTVEGGVRLLVSYGEERLVATVSDTGPGISPQDQERVFQAYERAGSHRAKEGAGLGLTISLRLARLMGGEVSLDSMPGEGCTVSVYVPVREVLPEALPAAEALVPPKEAAHAEKPCSILVCDDDEDMIALMEHYLHRAGYGLIAAGDSSEAIDKALKLDPDLVLMDCNLPGLSGVDAASVLRRQGYAKPIVALTASRLSPNEKNAFTRHFRKPAPMEDLLDEIKRLTH